MGCPRHRCKFSNSEYLIILKERLYGAKQFLIMGCLFLANALMRTRLPPRKQRPAHMQAKPDIKGIMTDVPYLVFAAGAFMVIR